MRYLGNHSDEADRIAPFLYFRGRNIGSLWDVVIGDRDEMRESLFSMRQGRHFVYTVAHFSGPALQCPVFQIGARDFPFHDLTRDEIAFDDRTEFSATYAVRRNDEPAVRAFLDRRLRGELAHAGCLWIETQPHALLCVSSEDYSVIAERERFLSVARKICSLVSNRTAV